MSSEQIDPGLARDEALTRAEKEQIDACVFEWKSAHEGMNDLELPNDARWSTLHETYGTVDKAACLELATGYFAMFLETPEIQRAFSLLRTQLRVPYQDNKYLNAETRPGMTLPYHNIRHAVDIMLEGMFLTIVDVRAKGQALDEDELFNIAVKGAYHDIGFMVEYKDNEDLGARYAKITLEDLERFKGLAYTSEKIVNIEAGIDSTKVSWEHGFRQNVDRYTSDEDRRLCDADVANIGRNENDFRARSKEMFKEQRHIGNSPEIVFNFGELHALSKEDLRAVLGFYKFGLNMFLLPQKWNSDVGYYVYEPQKRKNIEYQKRCVQDLEEEVRIRGYDTDNA